MKKYLKIMPDYHSNAIWGSDGVMLSLADLELNDDSIIRSLIIWNNEYEKVSDFYDSGNYPKDLFDKQFEDLRITGEIIAQNILNEHPNWDIYFTLDGTNLKHITTPKPKWKAVKI